jgi:proline iminopeptidase
VGLRIPREDAMLHTTRRRFLSSLANATGTLKDYDATDKLSKIAVPALFTAGEFDEATPTAVREFASMVPNASVEIIPDASHTAFLEQRDAYLAVLRKFLNEHAQNA